MTLDTLKRLRADLAYIRDDPDADLTDVQTFHLSRALRTVREAITAAEAERARVAGMIPSLAGRTAN
jgi:hypothetical protein